MGGIGTPDGGNGRRSKRAVWFHMLLWVGASVQAEEEFLTSDQQRDHADVIAVVTLQSASRGSNFVMRQEGRPRHASLDVEVVQEWRYHLAVGDVLKGSMPAHPVAHAYDHLQMICPNFNAAGLQTGMSYIVFLKRTGDRLEFLHNSNQSHVTVRPSYDLCWFERVGRGPDPYELRRTNLAHHAYLQWLKESP